MRIAIVAALPGELKRLVKAGWKRAPSSRKTVSKWVARVGDVDCVAVCGGMGAEAARQAFAEAEADGRIDMVLSVGWAGALVEELTSGATYLASAVVDAQTGERFDVAQNGSQTLVLVSTARVAQAPEKNRLAAAYNGSMVDMESATVARLARMRGIPVLCLKAISDDLHELLPDFNLFIDARGHMRMAAFIAHVMVRPGYWGALIRLGRGSAKGAETLASAVLAFLTGPKDAEAVNRSGNVNW